MSTLRELAENLRQQHSNTSPPSQIRGITVNTHHLNIQLHPLTIPLRSLLFTGPMRSGKTYAIWSILKPLSWDRKIVLIGTQREFDSRTEELDSLFQGNVVRISTDCKDVGDVLRSRGWSTADVGTVAILQSSVYGGPGKLLMYEEVGKPVQDWLNKLSDPGMMLPFVYAECHMADNLHHPAFAE